MNRDIYDDVIVHTPGMSLGQCTEELRLEVDRLESQLQAEKARVNDKSLMQVAKEHEISSVHPVIRTQRTLSGHSDKIYCVAWSSDSKRVTTVAQDSRLIVWNAYTGNKTHAVSIKSPWVLTCAFSPGQSRYVAEGGLSNLVSVYDVSTLDSPRSAMAELRGHTGYVASVAFLEENLLVSGSGDASVILWDLRDKKRVVTLQDHQADVTSVKVSPSDSRIILSGACDSTARIWDLRTGKAERTFFMNKVDVNAVEFFPSSNSFGIGLDNGQSALIDIRADAIVSTYANNTNVGVTSLTFSRSGRLLITSYDEPGVHVWDTLTGARVSSLSGHSRPVSRATFSPDGKALATASWDTTAKIWA